MDQLKATLLALPDKIRRKVLLSALRKGAAVVRKAARAATPELAKPTPYRTKGLLKKRLMVRVSRTSKAAGHVGVFVNIRPAEGTQYVKHNLLTICSGSNTRPSSVNRSAARAARMTRSTGDS